ncbi:conserved hypothetical protein [Verrucomicrobia bacterium]|nr:conserved hypothetical protein [Verrucomicrobiota bacterium]
MSLICYRALLWNPGWQPCSVFSSLSSILAFSLETRGALLYKQAAMQNLNEPKIAKGPFLVGDILLLGAACFICWRSALPLGVGPALLVAACVAAGALLAITPYLLQYRLLSRLAETDALTSVVAQIQNLEAIAGRIAGATAQWQTVQEQSDKTAAGAKAIAERMAGEVRAFTEFMERANDSEKATLRLEVEKLRRAENDWLQVLVRTLDHVYALSAGAQRSGLPNVIAQVSNFQNACREAARRVGLAPFAPQEAEPFDGQRHQLVEPDVKAGPDALVGEILATGYTYQGRLLRPALVRLRNGHSENPPASANEKPDPAQNLLPLGQQSQVAPG